ncbi:MAG: 50S ribosomal protein L24 [Patescibacteria group bacterium]|jgi:large subunit ribosomal protein L24|nr:50S ribosomal protein L24 [Patescibacteria group bacterium]
MKIKKNDQVKILAGKDRGKTGKVLQVFPRTQRASIEGLNILIKHLRPQQRGEKGQRIEFPGLINMSNLALICPKCGQSTRVSYKNVTDSEGRNKKFRMCKKCQETFE